MLIKLTGNRYVNSECIESIDKSQYSATPNGNVNWTVRLVSGNYIGLTQVQFEELLSAIPAPYDAESKRRNSAARRAITERIGWDTWNKLSEDEQYDMLNAEVANASTQ